MICPKCNFNNPEGAGFCNNCGNPLTDSKPEKNKFLVPAVIFASVILLAMIVLTVIFVSARLGKKEDNREEAGYTLEDKKDKTSTSVENEESSDGPKAAVGDVKFLERESMISGSAEDYYDVSLVPSVKPYSVSPDLSEVVNPRDFENLDDDAKRKLAKNLFVVNEAGYDEFFEIYEDNRYNMTPNFVTVDSMMHTYHLYFAHLLKTIEKGDLYDELCDITEVMLDNSIEQYDALKGSEWEDAALRNVAFFTVAGRLLGMNVDVISEVKDVVNEELDLVDGEGLDYSPLFEDNEDYSQYKPRGYYAGDETLEKYFKGMMWYGRRGFEQKSEEHMRSALLMVLSMDEGAFDGWEAIYTVTSFFAGVSDDCTYYEFKPVVEKAYGDIEDVSYLIGDEDSFDTFYSYTKKMEPPKINSIPVEDGDDPVISTFRFMGQRFSIDAQIMQNLVYSYVGSNSSGDSRMLPDALDIPAALGSATAYDILDEQGDTDYEGYDENLDKVSEMIDPENNEELWNASLYSQWLNTVRPLLKEKGEGYPSFMQSVEWNKRSIEGFLGSYTELKHDTILYSKQIMAEMGDGGWDEVFDDRGYVEPEPVVFARLALLARSTSEGLEMFGMLDSRAEEDLDRIYEMSVRLASIADKELAGESIGNDDYDFIREIGGDVEHLWDEATRESDDEYLIAYEHPCPIVADIATDPNGSVLEVGTGGADVVYVICPVEGKLKVCRGPVFRFYEFAQPMSDRLTDDEWREMLGMWPGEKFDYYGDPNLKQPAWTDSYRHRYDRNAY
ncbi:MAG: DUF3160 domain-containing protein [Lachnospiraceae bacterium]|nr:DUF3160 domain-containing protein [Lachnospiraceae bacterium]